MLLEIVALTVGIALAVLAVTCAMLALLVRRLRTLDRAAGLGDGAPWWLDFERQLTAYLRQRSDERS